MSETTIVALVAIAATLIGALSGPLLTAWQQRRNAVAQERRDVYRDALMHAAGADRYAQNATDGVGRYYRYERRTPFVPVAAEDVRARLELYGTQQARQAFTALIKASEGLNFEIGENGGDPDEGLSDDDPNVVALRAAAAALRAACRSR